MTIEELREAEMGDRKSYGTEAAAKRAANKAYGPVVVELKDGSFDWFPQGHPLPEGAIKVSQWVINSWRKF